MKKIIILVLLTALTAAFAAMADSETYVESRAMVLMQVSGEVTLSVGGKAEFPARAGATLRTGYAVRTGADGEAYFQIDDDKLIKLAPNSAVVISQANDRLKLTLRTGELVFSVTKPQPEDSVSVDTAGVSMSIRGTSGYLRLVKDAINSAIKCGLFDGKVTLTGEKLLLLIEKMELGELPDETVTPLDTGNASPHALLAALENDMQIDLPDDLLSDEDIQTLSRLWNEQLEEENKGAGFVGDNRYLTDAEIVDMAYKDINALKYDLQPVGTTEEQIVSYISGLIEPIAEKHGVTVQINKIEYKEPVDGGANYPNGTNGEYDFNVTVTLNAATDETKKQTVEVAPNKYSGTSNMERLRKYKDKVEKLSIPPIRQKNLTDESGIQSHIISNIADSLNDDKVSIRLNCELVLPIAGSDKNPNGVNGSYTYSVTLKRGTREITTDEMRLSLVAKTYQEVMDEEQIANAISAIQSEDWVIDQEYAGTVSDARAEMLSAINVLLSDGYDAFDQVSMASTGEGFTAATAGDGDNVEGVPGSYSGRVYLRKGEYEGSTACNALISPTVYSGLSNSGIVSFYEEIITGAEYEAVTVAELTNISSLNSRLLSEINSYANASLSDSGYDIDTDSVSISIVSGEIVEPASDGTRAHINGFGMYEFSANVTCGGSSSTIPKIISIERAEYMGATNEDIVNACVDKLTGTPFTPVTQSTAVGANALSEYILGEARRLLSDEYAVVENGESVTLSSLVSLGNATSGNSFTTPPVAGTISDIDGTNGVCAFTVTITASYPGAEDAIADASTTMVVTATPYTYTYSDYVDFARNVVRSITLSRTYGNEEESLELNATNEYVQSAITTAFRSVTTEGSGVIDISSHVKCSVASSTLSLLPTDGTADNPSGTDGNVSCSINILTSDNTVQDTISRNVTLKGASYTGTTNAEIISECIQLINGYTFSPLVYTESMLTSPINDYSIAANLESQVETLISGIQIIVPSASASVPQTTSPGTTYIATVVVTDIRFVTSAYEGRDRLDFTVRLSRGSASGAVTSYASVVRTS